MDPEKSYRALLDERARLVAEARGTLTRARQEGRELTAEEKQRDDAIHVRLTELNAEIEREERLRDAERTTAGAASDVHVTTELVSMSLNPPTLPSRAAAGRITDVRDRSQGDRMNGFASFSEFAVAVRTASRQGGHVDPRLLQGAPTNFHREYGGDTEGYLVPAEMRDAIWQLVFPEDATDIIDMLDWTPTNSPAITMLADESTPWGVNGIRARWRDEGEQMTPTKAGVEPKTVRLHELYVLTAASEEILQDAPRLENLLTRGASRAFRWKISEAVMYGDGVGKPLGWMASPALVTVAKEGSQTADTVNVNNIAKMYSRLIDKNGAFWVMNSDVLPQLMTMTLSNQPIWTPPNGFIGAPAGMLLGKPIIESEHADTVGDLGDIQLINPDGYFAARRTAAPQYAESIHLWFDYGVKAFRWMFRIGGMPYLSAPVAGDKSANTKSHFVALAERA